MTTPEPFPDCPTPRGACPNSAHPWRCMRSVPCQNQALAMDLDELYSAAADLRVEWWTAKHKAGEPLHPQWDWAKEWCRRAEANPDVSYLRMYCENGKKLPPPDPRWTKPQDGDDE